MISTKNPKLCLYTADYLNSVRKYFIIGTKPHNAQKVYDDASNPLLNFHGNVSTLKKPRRKSKNLKEFTKKRSALSGGG